MTSHEASRVKARYLLQIGAVVTGIVAVALQVLAIHYQSLTADEPHFLRAGYQAVHHGQNTMNLEHPPLVVMLAALPLAHMGIENPSRSTLKDPAFEPRVRLAGRYMLLVTIALPFLVSCFLLGREVAGTRAGVVLALTMGLSLNVIPFLAIVQTDAALGLGYLVTLYAVVRFMRDPRLLRVVGLGAGLGLTLAAKLSGIWLIPAVVLAILITPGSHFGWRRRIAYLSLVALLSGVILHGTYALANRNYESTAGREAIHQVCHNGPQSTLIVDDQMRRFETPLLAIEQWDPLIAQYLTGLLGVAMQNKIGVYAAYAFGEISTQGRWWFFPILLLIRTPLVLLLATGYVLFSFIFHRFHSTRQNGPPDPCGRRIWVVLVVAVSLPLGVAICSKYNLGDRHLLPVLPLLFLPTAIWAARRRAVAGVLVGTLLVEAVALNPLWMSATNTWWLGDRNPTQDAVIFNSEYQQNFIALADATRERGIDPLYIAFPVLPEAEMRTYQSNGLAVHPAQPLPPGWYAVNVIVEKFLPAVLKADPSAIYGYERFGPLAEAWRPFSETMHRRGQDYGSIAGTFRLYYLPP